MLDPKLIREDPEAVKAGAIKKHFPDRAAAVDRFMALDAQLLESIPKLDDLRAQQKAKSKEMGKVMATLSPEERETYLAAQSELKEQIKQLEEQQRELNAARDLELMQIPNIPAEDVPEGKDDRFNTELRTWGKKPDFDFEPRPHYELGEAQGWMDFERAAKISGSRNYFLMGEAAELQDAVLRFATDQMIQKGFKLVDPPLLVRDAAMEGTAFFPGGEEQTYRCEKDELNLIGTSEVPVTSIHADEILDEAELPKLYVGRSSCFRREAGTYGKDTRGLYRVHQFQKVEQVIVDIADEQRSIEHHEFITKNSEDLLQALGLPYRVVVVCGGDLGAPQIKKFDIECWMPSRESYGETHSASRFHDFQARRLMLRYRRSETRKVAFCHTLNNTVLASPRILIPLLEIHQQADGRVAVPECLQAYLGGRTHLGAPLT